MKPSNWFFSIPLLLCLIPAHAQAVVDPVPAATVATTDALRPFVATYQVFNKGRQLGDASLQLVAGGGDRWRIDLLMKGRGLMRLTGLNVQQSTVFERIG
ncbi:MAG: DUF3108 domain-containing protein, partial [Gammaproteobacteria bacterium]|nr:DUF3108 domain-containing protein [Gammaproteobacteria bacterium]